MFSKRPRPSSSEFFVKKTSQTHHGTLSELNITPLLDLVFVLLVIFIITAPQMMNNLQMNLPSGKPPAKKADQPKINKIFVNARGQTSLNNEIVTIPQLRTRLEAMKAENPELGVVVKGADETDYQNMINVLDVLRQLDITKVGLATEDTSPTS